MQDQAHPGWAVWLPYFVRDSHSTLTIICALYKPLHDTEQEREEASHTKHLDLTHGLCLPTLFDRSSSSSSRLTCLCFASSALTASCCICAQIEEGLPCTSHLLPTVINITTVCFSAFELCWLSRHAAVCRGLHKQAHHGAVPSPALLLTAVWKLINMIPLAVPLGKGSRQSQIISFRICVSRKAPRTVVSSKYGTVLLGKGSNTTSGLKPGVPLGAPPRFR